MRPSVDIDDGEPCSVHATRLRGRTPEEQLLAIFDVFHDWFQEHEDYDRLLVPTRPMSPRRAASTMWHWLPTSAPPARGTLVKTDVCCFTPSAPAHPTS